MNGLFEGDYLDRGGKPTLREFLRHLVFSPADGNIRLNNARLVMQRASVNANLRDDLTRNYGAHDARIILTRLGFKAGVEDAEMIRASWPHLDPGDAFTAGTRLHTLNGIVRVETVHNDFDFRRGRFSGEFRWHNGAEATEYHRRHGRSMEPVCWMQVGYASGYASSFFDRLIVYKESSCAAMGHAHCVVAGKLAEAWGERDEDVRMFRDEIVQSPLTAPARRPHARREAASAAQAASASALLLAPMQAQLDIAAQANVPLLISGQPGTGKRAAARYFCAAAHGSDTHPHMLCCAELGPDMLGSLLAPTPTRAERSRRSHDAPSGLVLEDIEALSVRAQMLLLTYLEAQPRPSATRIATTTSLGLEELGSSGSLRRDLFHRLTILPLATKPLDARRADLPELVAVVLREAARRFNRAVPELTNEALNHLCSRDYPGNLPELESLVASALLRCGERRRLDRADFAHDVRTDADTARRPEPGTLQHSLRQTLLAGEFDINALNRQAYVMAMELADGNVSEAARMVGLSRAQLAYRYSHTDPARA